MQLDTSRTADTATISVAGDMDSRTAYDVYLAASVEAEQGVATVVLDLAGVGFIDSVGLGMLIRIRDELGDAGHALQLQRVSPQVTRLLELTALLDQFRIV